MNEEGLMVSRWQIRRGAAQWFSRGCPMPRRPLMVRAALLRRSCDGVVAATELRRPAPSRSFCASRLDATCWMRSQHHFPPCWS